MNRCSVLTREDLVCGALADGAVRVVVIVVAEGRRRALTAPHNSARDIRWRHSMELPLGGASIGRRDGKRHEGVREVTRGASKTRCASCVALPASMQVAKLA
jgi:hypothetical protein